VGPLPAPGPAGFPVVFGISRDGSYLSPGGATVPFSQSPATVAASQTASLLGSNLGIAGLSDQVYLLTPDGGAEVDVTAWAVAADSSPAKFVLTVPAATGQAPAATPEPGVYQLRVGSGPAGAAGATRSGSTPVSIAALVHPATGQPVLTGPPPFTVTGSGFMPGATDVLVGPVPLTPAAASPAPGEFSIDPSGTSVTFFPSARRAPLAGEDGTVVPVRVRVNGIESDPAVWVTL
jgi:hypothetical protein